LILDDQLSRLRNVGKAEALRESLGVVTAFEYKREILNNCIWLASVEGRFECLDLSVLAGKLLLDHGNLTLMLRPCLLKSMQPFSFPLLMLLNRRFILVTAGLESRRIALSCPGY